MNYEKLEQRFYEKHWLNIRDWNRQGSVYQKKDAGIEGLKTIAFLKKVLVKKSKILDIGCGGGRNTLLFQSNGFEAFGADFSKTAVKLAEKLKHERGSTARFFNMSVFNLGFKDSFFDAVADFGLLHHLRKSEWLKYLNSVKRVLKKKGYLVLYCFSAESSITRNYKGLRNWNVKKGHYYHYFTKDELGKLLGNDFKILKIELLRDENRKLVFWLLFAQKRV